MIEIEEALKLINNLDRREPLRRYGSKCSTIFISRSGDIVGVNRHKDFLSTADLSKEAESHPNAFFFIAISGELTTGEALLKRVNDAVSAHKWEEDEKAQQRRRRFRWLPWFIR